MNFERFDEASFSQLRKDLIHTKGSDAQRAFLTLLRDSRSFCWYLEDRVSVEIGRRLRLLNMKLDESDYKEPSKDMERKIFETWRDLSTADACSSGLWGLLQFRRIQSGVIESHFLAANRTDPLSGEERIISALNDATDKEIDDIVRDVLRHLCGLPEARGNRSVYVDCIFGRAWWRGYLCNKVCKQTGADPDKVTEVFRVSQGYWEELVAWSLSRNLIPGDAHVHNALIWTLSEYVGKEEYARFFTVAALQKILQLIDRRSERQNLSAVPSGELRGMMEDAFFYLV